MQFNDRNIYTCPASLSDVIGVKCDKSSIPDEGQYMYNTFAPDGIEVIACARHSIVESEVLPYVTVLPPRLLPLSFIYNKGCTWNDSG